ncbi:MAPK/MAK/MRK overlapping kinase-like isoform X2 [Megalobrama amblycephala]|uniref:MAPK/MAK/MRK overlapping kinase-like isoform X2 n=1 Tax=Megalobrama amblycephala TaxID=75352 RepID=UPI00201468E0|nr:MAPK/MAK/MRK overlapping kinase-like isoform X2 [Megalobrama amblycephala]
MNNYRVIRKIGEGTFSEVMKVQSLKDGKHYACKTMKQTIASVDQAHGLREVQAMKRLSPHPNILQLHELIYDKDTGTLSLICELMEMNIYEFIKGVCLCVRCFMFEYESHRRNTLVIFPLPGRQHPVSESKAKHYMYQLCRSLDHMHSHGIFHRDVKPENILIKNDVLKLADFGSCRSIYSKPPHTEYISTRWYRAPECLLTDGHYSQKMDMWSAGCVFFEILSLSPLFPGRNELDQVNKIHDVLGTPDGTLLQKFKQSRAMRFDFPPRKGCGISQLVPHCSAAGLSLLHQMLTYDPEERISARAALQHPCFRELRVAERKAASLRKAVGAADGESSGTSVDQLWRLARQGRRQHLKHAGDPLSRRNASHFPLELPKLNVVVPTPKIPYPVSSFPALTVSHRGSLPAIPKKCHSRLSKPKEEPHHFKSYFMPPLERHPQDY